MERETRGRWVSFFYSRWFLVTAAGLVILIGVNYVRTFYRNYQSEQEIKSLQEEARRLEGKKIQALDILRYVQSSEFVEERARLELNLVKPGEKILITSNTRFGGGIRQEQSDVIQQNNLSNPSKWFNFFLK